MVGLLHYRKPHSVRDLNFDVRYTVFASHDIIYDVFCKVVNVGPIKTKFGMVVYYVPHRSQNIVCSNWSHNVDVWMFYGHFMAPL